MQEAEADAARNANLVHAITYQEAIAGIFKPPPSQHRADFMGLFLNCVVAGEGLAPTLAHRLQTTPAKLRQPAPAMPHQHGLITARTWI